MPNELGLYVVFFFGIFWIFIAFCGVIMKMHDRIDKQQGGRQH